MVDFWNQKMWSGAKIVLVLSVLFALGGCFSGGSGTHKDDNDTTPDNNHTMPVKKPDLSIGAFHMPKHVDDLQESLINFAVKNIGTKAIESSFRVGVYLSSDPAMDPAHTTLVAQCTINQLGAGKAEYLYDMVPVLPASMAITPGTVYYAKVEADMDDKIAEANESNNFSNMATIELTMPIVRVSTPTDAFEDDDVMQDAKEFVINTVQRHNFFDDPQDWVKFSLSSSYQYTLETFDLGMRTNTRLTLLDEFLDTNISDIKIADVNVSKLAFRPPLNGDFYLKISSIGGLTGPNLEYSLMIRSVPVGVSDAYEDDDTQNTAQFIAPNSLQDHNFYDDTHDWLCFDALKDANYTIETDTNGSRADTLVILYDRDGTTELARDDNSSANSQAASRLVWQAPHNGRYYIDVVSADGDIGDYRNYTFSLTEKKE